MEIRNICKELDGRAKEISRKSSEGTAWLLLTASTQMRELRDELRKELVGLQAKSEEI